MLGLLEPNTQEYVCCWPAVWHGELGQCMHNNDMITQKPRIESMFLSFVVAEECELRTPFVRFLQEEQGCISSDAFLVSSRF